MTPSSPRSGPDGRQPGEHGEQPSPSSRPVSDPQRYGQRPRHAQQPRHRRHSDGRRDRQGLRQGLWHADRTAIVTGIVAVAALLVAGAGAWLITKDSAAGGTAAPASTAPALPGGGGRLDSSVGGSSGDVPGAAADAKVGDCIRVDKADETDAVIATVRCADRRAVYRVGVREQGRPRSCPGENYVSYTEDGLLLCLTLNAKKGACFEESENQDVRVPCDSPDASYRVTEIFRGTEDSSRCGDNPRDALTYPRPPLTICRVAIE